MVTPPVEKKTDSLDQLLCAGLAGDHAAYQQFLTLAAQYLRRFVARRIPPADREDVVQEILLSLHKARHTYDGKRSVLPWISAIARYRLTDYLRRYYATRQHAKVDIAEVEHFLTEDVTETSPLSESVSAALANLSEREQKIIYLMHTEGYTAKEVGKQLEMNESAVKVAAHRAYKRIKTRLSSL